MKSEKFLHVTKDKNFKLNSSSPLPEKIDYILFFVIAVGCFFSFQNSDIVHTVSSSVGCLNGHWLDFYDYNAQFELYDSYMPSTYILFAIWNIPCYMLGILDLPVTDDITFGILMWNKLLPCIIYMLSGQLVCKIGKEVGMGDSKSKLCAYAFLTSPIGFFSQFIFGQYDVFTLFFVLSGFYFWLKDKETLFILCFGVSFTFKYFALLVFVPLLLLKNKNILKILVSLALSFIPFAIEVIVYFRSVIFREYVFGFQPTGYVNITGINTGIGIVSVVVLFCGIIAAYAYFVTVESKDESVKWSIYIIGLMMFAVFGIGRWHPQWLLLMVPFLVFGAFIHSDTKIFMVLDLLLMLFFVIFIVNEFSGAADEILLERGVFGKYIRYESSLREILFFGNKDLALSFYVVLLLIMVLFKHPRYLSEDVKKNIDKEGMWFIRGRFVLGVAFFIVPAIVFLAIEVLPPYVTFHTRNIYSDISGMIDREVTQVFISKKGVLESIEFPVGTYGRENDVTLNISLRDADTRELLFSQNITMKDIDDNEWVCVDTDDLRLEIGGTYRIDISCSDGESNNCVTLYRTENRGNQLHGYAIIGGERMDYHLCIKIVENKQKK
ncbi:MAG: DUF2029 domain-containing protein [Lachnospiraceae bacterium]|nr:DUF2029 domain-containing protein [Lachnospiraceae bacterium]